MSARMRLAGLLATAAGLTLAVAPLASAAVTAPAPFGPGPGHGGHAFHHGHQHNPWDDDGYGECGYHYCPGYPYGSDYGQSDGGHHGSPYGARADHDPRGRYGGGWGDDDGPIDGWSYHDVDGSWCWRNWC